MREVKQIALSNTTDWRRE